MTVSSTGFGVLEVSGFVICRFTSFAIVTVCIEKTLLWACSGLKAGLL